MIGVSVKTSVAVGVPVTSISASGGSAVFSDSSVIVAGTTVSAVSSVGTRGGLTISVGRMVGCGVTSVTEMSITVVASRVGSSLGTRVIVGRSVKVIDRSVVIKEV